MGKIDGIINNIDDKQVESVDWTGVWSKKYRVLDSYKQVVDVDFYALKLRKILDEIKKKYNYSDLDSMLILKDILYNEWKANK